MATNIGDVIDDRYRIVAQLGEGAMGMVFAAKHIGLETDCAIKVLRPELAVHGVMVERFRREAMEAARIDHPGIAKVTDFGRTREGAVYLAMELLDGETVRQRIERGQLPIDQAVRIAREALDALGAAHRRGVTHRDVKPENLFLTQDGRVKVLDFGIAKVREGSEKITGTGAMLGTPIYMAPDQMRDAASADARADLYSVGATLFHMLTGRPPVEGASIYDVVGKVLSGEAQRDPSALRPEVPPWLSAVVTRAMAREPAERFSSAAEMQRALEPQQARKSKTRTKKKQERRESNPGTGTVAQVPLIPQAETVIAATRDIVKPTPPRARRQLHPLAYGAAALLSLLTMFGIYRLATAEDDEETTAEIAPSEGVAPGLGAVPESEEVPPQPAVNAEPPAAGWSEYEQKILADRTVWKVPVEADDPARGPSDAAVTIVEFSEFQCPFCSKVRATLERVLKENDDVRLVWKDFPLNFHRQALTASNVAHAALDAGGQAAFWKAHDVLFEQQSSFGNEELWKPGGELQRRLSMAGVELPNFTVTVLGFQPHERVRRSQALGERVGVSGVPAFFINGRRFSGAQRYELFDAMVKAARNEAVVTRLRAGTREGLYERIIAGGREGKPDDGG